jgi:hypothetical protein
MGFARSTVSPTMDMAFVTIFSNWLRGGGGGASPSDDEGRSTAVAPPLVDDNDDVPPPVASGRVRVERALGIIGSAGCAWQRSHGKRRAAAAASGMANLMAMPTIV